ncbi:U3 small nucleolar RNA-associated protein 6 homolog [Odontomachus brunneus]|uniref:U3 small nucleolar RNA-associated protein 6 homolog n=1 Tax=Odontomachus brunneus TaxID=486640 RepID=UPI0013F19AEC|nr:U3 small nucleolar RNA-associated protein 6 homolog [Odontomachus brunneus]
MAEFVEKRCEDMIPELEQMERIKLFNKNEIRAIARKYKEFEYKVQRHTKCKKDYEQYIHYKMNLLALIKQRRHKYGNLKKKSDIDYAIANKIDNLYKNAIFKFQDLSLWVDYLKFCKQIRFRSNISHMLGRMLQIHGNKPKCWHIAACWELEENNNKQKACQYIFSGLHIHPDSPLLYMDAFRFELDDYVSPSNDAAKTEDQEDDSESAAEDREVPLSLDKAYLIYQQASEHIRDIKFIIQLLTITEEYDNTEKLQKKITCDMIQNYPHEPLIWDKIAHRELDGLVQPDLIDISIELDSSEQSSQRSRIISCSKVYQLALQNIETEEMWSLYIECLLNINKDLESLPNFKRKLLKTALAQAHRAKKLKEKYYIYWIDMLSLKIDDEDSRERLYQFICKVTDAVPNSVILWHARMKHLLLSKQDEEAAAICPKATRILGEKALPLWKMWILHEQTTNPKKTEEVFQAALQIHPLIARDIKPYYIEWLASTKSIHAARKAYDSLCLQAPFSLECYKKMVSLEVMQPEISLKHARRPHELATHLFGKNDKSVWMDYINFENKHGEPWKAGQIYERALKELDGSLTSSFIEDHVLIKINQSQMEHIS